MGNLGYIGLGVMGGRMADRLLTKGHRVTGYNRTRAKAQWVIDRGVVWADSPRAVAAAADVTFVMVANSAALEAVADGPDGFVAGLGPGKVVVDMSTVSPALSREIAGKVRGKGAAMVDAPVSGSVSTLEAGKVSMKIAANLSLAVQMLAFSEGVLLAEKSGIARETAVDVLIHSVIGSPMVQYRGPFVLKMPDEAWFNVNMMQKDLQLALEMGRRLEVPLPTSAAANEWLTAARAMGLGEQDFAAVFQALARAAGAKG